jgi:sulfur-oxidizing protein SoxX
MPAPEQADHGDIGPDLGGVADRLSEAEMRLRLIDSKQINEDTIMPSFYMSRRLFRVQKKWKNKTLLKAEEVEDIIAYLKTLK